MKKILFFMATLCCLFLLVPNTTQAATKSYKTGYINNKKKVKIYTSPGKKSQVIKKVSHGTKIKYKKYNKNWYMVKINKQRGYIQSKHISNKKMAKQTNMQYTWSYFRRMGVIYWGNWTWTWYSQRVLPGGGLHIPGRHVNQNGYVCDEGGYICLASSVLSRGTVVDTPFGSQGKIYDSGCSSHILDVYVNW